MNDSLDEFIAWSQAHNADLEANRRDLEDSFDNMMSQVDETEYLEGGQRSPKSKVQNWLDKENPQPIQKQNENFQYKTHEVDNFQMVRMKTNVNKFQQEPFQHENRENISSFANLQDRVDSRRQDMIFRLLSREQDLRQQELDQQKSEQRNR